MSEIVAYKARWTFTELVPADEAEQEQAESEETSEEPEEEEGGE